MPKKSKPPVFNPIHENVCKNQPRINHEINSFFWHYPSARVQLARYLRAVGWGKYLFARVRWPSDTQAPARQASAWPPPRRRHAAITSRHSLPLSSPLPAQQAAQQTRTLASPRVRGNPCRPSAGTSYTTPKVSNRAAVVTRPFHRLDCQEGQPGMTKVQCSPQRLGGRPHAIEC
jgi:hypothetical protein